MLTLVFLKKIILFLFYGFLRIKAGEIVVMQQETLSLEMESHVYALLRLENIVLSKTSTQSRSGILYRVKLRIYNH